MTTYGSTDEAHYGEAWYWDKRYSQDPSGPFDWYQKYNSLAPLLNLYIPRHHRVLVVGCGNSAFSEGMVSDGYQDIYNVDVSCVAIQAMQNKYASVPQLKYIQMDVRAMNAFEAGFFDAVIDKGTLDSILCGSNSRENADKMLKEIARVLKDKGVYILITYGAPNFRVQLLRHSSSWSIKLHAIEKHLSEESSKKSVWDVTSPVPLDDNGVAVEAVLGKNSDVHYIYVCIKDQPSSIER